MAAEIIEGDLLQATEDAIVQQCNCVANKPHGLSSVIFEKWPEADCYSIREQGEKDKPGSIIVKECEDGKMVINLIGQYYPGKARWKNDDAAKRLAWFKRGLQVIGTFLIDTHRISSIAFPFRIGCGLAGGNWDDYSGAIENFANQYPNVSVKIYKLE